MFLQINFIPVMVGSVGIKHARAFFGAYTQEASGMSSGIFNAIRYIIQLIRRKIRPCLVEY